MKSFSTSSSIESRHNILIAITVGGRTTQFLFFTDELRVNEYRQDDHGTDRKYNATEHGWASGSNTNGPRGSQLVVI